jgi:hypothetical protein
MLARVDCFSESLSGRSSAAVLVDKLEFLIFSFTSAGKSSRAMCLVIKLALLPILKDISVMIPHPLS